MASEKRGNPRKSRRARLPSATFAERAIFNPSREQWQQIENSFPIRLRPEDRKVIVEIVNNYLGMQPFETAAPFVDNAQAYLEELLVKASGFLFLLQSPNSNEAASFVRTQITKIMALRKSGPADWMDIVHFLEEFMVAGERAKLALSKYEKGGGFVEGEAWRSLIRELSRFCKERSLPTAASKAAADPPSPFVAFVTELQRALPERFRRHGFSTGALATAIGEARKSSAREPNANGIES